jgi:hypothetical protein
MKQTETAGLSSHSLIEHKMTEILKNSLSSFKNPFQNDLEHLLKEKQQPLPQSNSTPTSEPIYIPQDIREIEANSGLIEKPVTKPSKPRPVVPRNPSFPSDPPTDPSRMNSDQKKQSKCVIS